MIEESGKPVAQQMNTCGHPGQNPDASESNNQHHHLKPPHTVLLSPRRLSVTPKATDPRISPTFERDSSSWSSHDPEKVWHAVRSMQSQELASQPTGTGNADEDSEFYDEDIRAKKHVLWILVGVMWSHIIKPQTIDIYDIRYTFPLSRRSSLFPLLSTRSVRAYSFCSCCHYSSA